MMQYLMQYFSFRQRAVFRRFFSVPIVAMILGLGIGANADTVTLYSFDLSSDPGWAREGNWAYGVPTADPANHYSNLNPTSGFTGSNVFGYNLDGDYADGMSVFFLTTDAMDFSLSTGVTLEFRRWLGVESSFYDHAFIQVSIDGTNWTTIWANPTDDISESAWSLQSYDISSIADGESSVSVRWGMGPTDGILTYSGWNIDDIRFLGDGRQISFDFSADPGWAIEGEWGFGVPAGLGGVNGNPDPSSGATGSNVFGINLNGDYSIAPGGPSYMTTEALNLDDMLDVKLSFRRWLNADVQNFATETVEVSNNASVWTTVWENDGAMAVTESSWSEQFIDISSIAARQSTVFVRWGHTTTSGALGYSGWNIDDVIFSGHSGAVLTVTPEIHIVERHAGGRTFTVSNSGGRTLTWSASESCDWVQLENASGTDDGVIRVTFFENTISDPRSCAITVSANVGDKIVTLTQVGVVLPPLLLTSAGNLVIASSGGTSTIEVTNGGGGDLVWTASANCEGMTLSPPSGTNAAVITVTFGANPETVSRACTVEISSTEFSDFVTFTQAASASDDDDENNGGGGGGGCFIATAAYGTPLAGEIWELRKIRDGYLLTNPLGSLFTDSYYRLGPPTADFVARHGWAKGLVRAALIPLIFVAKFDPGNWMPVGFASAMFCLGWASRRRSRKQHLLD